MWNRVVLVSVIAFAGPAPALTPRNLSCINSDGGEVAFAVGFGGTIALFDYWAGLGDQQAPQTVVLADCANLHQLEVRHPGSTDDLDRATEYLWESARSAVAYTFDDLAQGLVARGFTVEQGPLSPFHCVCEVAFE